MLRLIYPSIRHHTLSYPYCQMPTHRPKDVNHSLLHFSFYPCRHMVEIRNHNFGWHQFPEVLPFSFSSTPPLSSVTKARHNLLTGIMELLIINVIFSSFPKIYSELSSAGGTRHISQSNLPQKLPVSFRWTGVKRRRQRLILQAEIIPGILPANCIHVLHILLVPLWIPLLRQRFWYPTRTLLSCDVCKHTMYYTVFYPCLHSARLSVPLYVIMLHSLSVYFF